MPTQSSDEDRVAMQLQVMELHRLGNTGCLAKGLLLFCYGFLDIGRNGMVQRMKYRAHFGDDTFDIHHGRDPLATMLNCFADDLQFDAELAKMGGLSGFREDE
jgi:hypothetical protein